MQQAAKAVLTEYGDAISALRTLATQGIASATRSRSSTTSSRRSGATGPPRRPSSGT